MKQSYLFVHFKEKTTVDGEQVYFALSQDGFHWDMVNGGKHILCSTKGDQGVRDFTIIRTNKGRFYILATDLALARHFKDKYKNTWEEIARNGSKDLVLWESYDLLHWSDQRMVRLGDEDFGCLWAPDIIHDANEDDYVIHWSSSHRSNNYGYKKIYYSRTKDFEHFSKPEVLYEKEDSGIIDSAMYEMDGAFYLFVKCERNPETIILLKSSSITGPFIRVFAFDEEMAKLEQGKYEAPTACKLEDSRLCLFLDFYGTTKDLQGYVPFVSQDIASGKFTRSDKAFSFPYGFKHGTILTITPAEYDRIKLFDDWR